VHPHDSPVCTLGVSDCCNPYPNKTARTRTRDISLCPRYTSPFTHGYIAPNHKGRPCKIKSHVEDLISRIPGALKIVPASEPPTQCAGVFDRYACKGVPLCLRLLWIGGVRKV
jgi:hypothetical protein